MRWCHWYSFWKVQRKRKLESYSAIHLLDESEMSRRREILDNFKIFKIFKIFWKFQFFSSNLHTNIIYGRLRQGSRLDESFRRKPGWRFTAGFEYGCSWQLVGTEKNFNLFIILGAFFFKLMNSFTMRRCHWYFSRKVQKKRKPGSYLAIHFLDESKMSRTRQIWVNLVIFKIFKIFWKFQFFF